MDRVRVLYRDIPFEMAQAATCKPLLGSAWKWHTRTIVGGIRFTAVNEWYAGKRKD